jgi:hypothetical protein
MACAAGTPAKSAADLPPTAPIPEAAEHVELQVVTGSRYGTAVRTLNVRVEEKSVRVEPADGEPHFISVERWNKARELLNTGLAAATPTTERGCYFDGMDCRFKLSSDGATREGCCVSPIGLAIDEGAAMLVGY